MNKDSILKIAAVVGIVYTSLLLFFIGYFALSGQALSGIYISYTPVVTSPNTQNSTTQPTTDTTMPAQDEVPISY